jgi:hypothetical protein
MSSFKVASVANIGSTSVCEKGCNCDSENRLDIDVYLGGFSFVHCIAVEAVQFDEFRISAGEINLNVCVTAPLRILIGSVPSVNCSNRSWR